MTLQSRIQDAATEALGSPAGRRALSDASIEFFDAFYCGMRYAAHRSRWFDVFGGAHKLARDTTSKQRALILAPRKHGKTEALITYATRAICADRNVRILWICANQDRAKERVRRIKSLLTSDTIKGDWCSAPRQGFGPFDGPGAVWDAQKVYVPRTLDAVDPTLIAVGYGGSITGGHFDVILLDDIEDDKTVMSARERSKKRNWFFGTVSPMLNPGGVMLGAGTRKHHDDLYSHLIKRATWRVIEDKAVIEWPEARDGQGQAYEYVTQVDPTTGDEIVVDVAVHGPSKVLWPEERGIKYLLTDLYEMGSRLFYREYQNEVQDDASAPVKWAHLEAAQDRGSRLTLYQVPPEVQLTYIVQGWDFAVVDDPVRAEAVDSDFTVGVTWGRDVEMNRYLLGIYRARGLTPRQIWDAMIREYQRMAGLGLEPRHVGVERNNTGAIHEWAVGKATDLPLVGHQTTGPAKVDPWDGIPTLGMLFERGKVVLPVGDEESREAVEVVCRELWGLGKETHDDTVMALWVAESVMRKRGTFKHRAAFGVGHTLDEDDDERIDLEELDVVARSAWEGLITGY